MWENKVSFLISFSKKVGFDLFLGRKLLSTVSCILALIELPWGISYHSGIGADYLCTCGANRAIRCTTCLLRRGNTQPKYRLPTRFFCVAAGEGCILCGT